MAKKNALLLFLLFISPCLLFGFEAGVTAGYFDLSGFSDFQGLKTYTKDMVTSGYMADVEENTGVLGLEFDLNAGFRGPVDIYAKIHYIPSINYHAGYSVPLSGKLIYDRVYSANQIYASLGIKFQVTVFGSWVLFAGADAGYSKLTSKTTDEYVITSEKSSVDAGVSGFAFSAEGGVKTYLGNNICLTIEGGYDGALRGAAAKAGLGYDFAGLNAGTPRATNAANNAKAAGYAKYGDYYYARRDYRKAIAYYSAAVKLSKNESTCFKIGNCYYALKDIKTAVAWYEYSLKIRDNPALRVFVNKLKAALAAPGGR